MNKFFLRAALAALAAGCAYPQDLAGDWQGTLDAGSVQLRLVVHISKTESGGWKGAMDSLDQGAAGIPIPSVTLKNSTVQFAVPSVHGTYTGKLNAAGTLIEGTWSQGQGLALNLARMVAAPATSDLDGAWSGTLHAGAVSVRTVFHFSTTAAGLTATVDSPDQGAFGMKASAVTRTGAALKIEFKQLGAVFEGSVYRTPPGISGTWKQSGAEIPLSLERAKEGSAAEPRRPQNPIKPYPYREEEVSYENKTAGITLAGTLTLPQGKGPFPAAVLICGSGQHDRDEALFGHKPFLVLADYLTRKGIAVLRSDKRGAGKSGGDPAKATSADFSTDAEAAFVYLLSRPEIDPKKIGFIGHSEGGMIAPMIAARNPHVAFIVLMAGDGVPGSELLPVQVKRLAEAAGASPEDAAKAAGNEREILQMIVQGKDDAAIEKRTREMGAPEAQIKEQMRTLDSPWFRFFLTYDPAESLRKVKCPVLALDGDKDTQVDAKQNLPAIRQALQAGGNKSFEIVELPGLNHLFQTAKTGSPAEYAQIEETIAPAVLEKISAWILAR